MTTTELEHGGAATRRPRVLLVYPLPHPAGEQLLVQHGVDIVRPDGDDEASLRHQLGDVDAVILRGPARLTAGLIDAAPRLQVIGAVGSGTDNIDVDAATRRQIPVVHGAGVAPRSVAEYVLGAMVVAHRGFLRLHEAAATGTVDWASRLQRYRSTELTGTTVGIIGYGHIGQTVGRLVQAAFDSRVLVYDPFVTPSDVGDGVRLVGQLDALLDESLTVTVHVPLLPSTRGLIGGAELRRIGSDGVLIDAARGGIVDEQALVEALRSRALKGAVVDVYEDEPPSAQRLAELAATPNLLLTPHVAGVTDQALAALSTSVGRGVLDALEGRLPPHVVNRTALARET